MHRKLSKTRNCRKQRKKIEKIDLKIDLGGAPKAVAETLRLIAEAIERANIRVKGGFNARSRAS